MKGIYILGNVGLVLILSKLPENKGMQKLLKRLFYVIKEIVSESY